MLTLSNNVIGPGHNANFVMDDAGQYWMFYHGFDATAPEEGRKVYLDQIFWDDNGWPYTATGHPSQSAKRPVVVRR